MIDAAPEAVRVADDAGHLPRHDGSDEAMVLLHEAAPDTATAAGYYCLVVRALVARVLNRTVSEVIYTARRLWRGGQYSWLFQLMDVMDALDAEAVHPPLFPG